MTVNYSEALIEQALVKVYSCGDRTIRSVAPTHPVGSSPREACECLRNSGRFTLTYMLANYPIHSVFGLMLQIARTLNTGRIASEIIGMELIGFASVLTKGLADVEWPNGLTSPIGANIYLLAPPSSGKSLIYRILALAIEAWLKQFNSVVGSGKRFGLFVEGETPEAILTHLVDCPIAALVTDEVALVTRLKPALLIKLVDRIALRSGTVTKGRTEVLDHSFSLFCLGPLEKLADVKKALRTSGCANRLLIACSNGKATVDGSMHEVKLSPEVEEAWRKKVNELLTMNAAYIEKPDKKRPVLRLSPKALEYFIWLEEQVRRQNASGSPLEHISEYIKRHIERVLRLSGSLHVFEYGVEGEISEDTLKCAAELCGWHIEAFAQAVYEQPKLMQADKDAAELERAILQFFHTNGISQCRLSEMRTNALNLGLTPTRFTRALATLASQGKVRVVSHRNTPWVLFNSLQIAHYR